MKKKKIKVVAMFLLMLGMIIVSEQTAQAKDIPIDKEHFSNRFFREYIKNSFDCNQDGILSDEELVKVTVIDIGENSEFRTINEFPRVASVKGIEYFPNLEKIDVSGNQIYAINLKENKKLKILDVDSNDIASLDISQNPNLEELYCSDNGLKKLDVWKNRKLKRLFCNDNKLSELNVSKNRKLCDLSFSNNKVRQINLSKCKELQNLYCEKNKLSELRVKANKDLITLNCSNNCIQKLNLSDNEMLENLYCDGNRLIQGNLFVMRSQLVGLSTSKQTRTVHIKKKKGYYMIPMKNIEGTNRIWDLSCGKVTKKGIKLSKKKKIPKVITYRYNMFTDGKELTDVELVIKD